MLRKARERHLRRGHDDLSHAMLASPSFFQPEIASDGRRHRWTDRHRKTTGFQVIIRNAEDTAHRKICCRMVTLGRPLPFDALRSLWCMTYSTTWQPYGVNGANERGV